MDLESRESQKVRAAIESNTIAEYLNVDYGYPGWSAEPWAVGVEARLAHPEVAGIGTAYLHIVPVETPSGVVTVVCKDMTGTAKKSGESYPYPDASDPRQALEVIAVSTRTGSPRPTMEGTHPSKVPPGPAIPGPANRSARPAGNVFSGYLQVNYPGTLNPPPYADACTAWTESRWGGTRPPTPTRSVAEPPKIEPFSPGWPG
ncbi:hypothetical protein LTV02_35305 [Nocardia yamanashiensis]|uniref:hypothetical protein n=1 Tax=Nocardia yamanashiensis TaxID=209247 RepID=UPI001E3090B8|nr:hypothetical protein [Nocardia yamanashiensis]UGT41156.1 hypothetical protein LTV02_35305 [Nocardia yamanashiensis]